MASISYASQEISVKIIYCGPGMSGKTTNLQVIHQRLLPELRSKLTSLSTENERTLFFDFLPLDLGEVKGFKIKLQLYTVPGQVYYNATRKLVLRGVDAIVFVADSDPEKMEENIWSLDNLEENLVLYKYKREEIPMIIQYNKRDLANALPVEQMQQRINRYNLPYVEAVAKKGFGVFETLKLISKNVIDGINNKYSLNIRKRPNQMNAKLEQQKIQQPSH
jgi:signal recognition particle receptor subunit beta